MVDQPLIERVSGAERLALALDTDDLVAALRAARQLRPYFGTAKVGLELYSAAGPDAVVALLDLGFEVFVDLKMFDIPTTVGKAARVVGARGASDLTVHTAGGEAMLRAAVEGLQAGAHEAGVAVPRALGVTVLTSEPVASPDLMAQRVAAAVAAGCGGIVCAAPDLALVRASHPDLHCVVPGIRPRGSVANDQKRVATPAEAIAAGAGLLVIGRAVIDAEDPEAAAASVAAEVASTAAPA
jgi:orotidine-5'-phosphate decarboxylase